MTAYLAHGALGRWDELIFLGVAVIFVVLMGISWVVSRNTEPDLPDDEAKAPDDGEAESGERFRLD